VIAMPQSVRAKIGDLRVAEYNPRIMPDSEMQALMESITTYGFVQPIIAREEDGEIGGGHQRLQAFIRVLVADGRTEEEIKDTEVPVVYVRGFDDAKMRALNLALNRIHGEWDYDKLAVVFDEIATLQPYEQQTVTGFTDTEIADIRALSGYEAPAQVAPDPGDIDAEIAKRARKLVFEIETDEDAAAVTSVLKAYGMTGPGNAADALVAVCKAAPPAQPTEEQPTKKLRAVKKKKETTDADDGDKAT
jgi:ParB-like chromosome segregation protein Spo0J